MSTHETVDYYELGMRYNERPELEPAATPPQPLQ